MNNFMFLLKLTENDKRMILMFVLLIIAALSLLILLALLIEKIGKAQAKFLCLSCSAGELQH